MTDAIASQPARKKAGKAPRPARPRQTSGAMRTPLQRRVDGSRASVTRVADLARAGQHAQAIELATEALGAAGLDVAVRLDLLDLRAESFVALGDLERAGADATAMLDACPQDEIGGVEGAGAQSPGVGGDAQRRGKSRCRERHGGAEIGAREQAIAADRDEPVSSRRSAIPREARRPGSQERDGGGRAVSQARRSLRSGARALDCRNVSRSPGSRRGRKQGGERGACAVPRLRRSVRRGQRTQYADFP